MKKSHKKVALREKRDNLNWPAKEKEGENKVS